MKTGLYAIYDGKAKEFGPIFEARNDEVASRQFRRLLEKEDYREDYTLYLVGDYDHENGLVTNPTGGILMEVMQGGEI